MKWGPAIRDVVIIFVSVAVASVLIGYSAGYAGVPIAETLTRVGLSSALIITAGFAISGALARERRWRHGFVVAAGLWLTGLVNVVFMPRMFLLWLFGWIPVLIFMGLGVSLSYLFVRSNSAGVASLAQSDAPNTPTPPEQR